jgi:hypothetical protein
MSYTVQIWEKSLAHPLLANIDAAVQLVEELLEAHPGQNPKFMALVERLTQRYPCLNDMPVPDGADEIDFNQLAWTDGNIDGQFDDAVFVLGINTSIVDEVQPFVIQEATALGLCVLDEQAGEAYLPGGRVLSVPRLADAPVEPNQDDDELPKTREVLRIIFERLTPLLTQHGYKARKGNRTFKRIHPGGWHEIVVGSASDHWPTCCEIEIYASTRIHPITDLVCAVTRPELSREWVEEQPTGIAAQRNWMDDEAGGFIQSNTKNYKVHNLTEIEAVIAHLSVKLKTRLLPLLQQCETLEGMEGQLNPESSLHPIFHTLNGGKTNIIAAYLARSPRLEQLCKELTAMSPKSTGYEEVQRCIEYVHSHPHCCPVK